MAPLVGRHGAAGSGGPLPPGPEPPPPQSELAGPIGVPRHVALELIRYCVDKGSLRSGGDWIASVIATMTEIRVAHVTLGEHRGGSGGEGQRFADVTVFEDDARAFQLMFPEATRLRRVSRAGTAVFRLRCATREVRGGSARE